MRTRTRDRSRRVPLVAHPHVAQQADLPGLARASSPPATVLQLALRASFPPLPVRGRGRAGGRSRRAAWCKTGGSARAGAPQRSGCGRIGDGRRVREGSRAMARLQAAIAMVAIRSAFAVVLSGRRAAGCGLRGPSAARVASARETHGRGCCCDRAGIRGGSVTSRHLDRAAALARAARCKTSGSACAGAGYGLRVAGCGLRAHRRRAWRPRRDIAR